MKTDNFLSYLREMIMISQIGSKLINDVRYRRRRRLRRLLSISRR